LPPEERPFTPLRGTPFIENPGHSADLLVRARGFHFSRDMPLPLTKKSLQLQLFVDD
jgi:hypothetical protein